ncbi:MAG: alpha/beta hydrolase [Peptostreptococcaceae bacterium]
MKVLISLKRKVVNVYRMIKYAYFKDIRIKSKIIHYGSNKKQYYKLYESNLYENKPLVVFIHGGGWYQGSPSLYSGIGKYFFKRGYPIIIIGYRLVPKYNYPTQIDDAFLALKHYMIENSNTKKIIIGGYSAGAEIASHLAFDTKRLRQYNIDKSIIKGFLSISGVLDFTKCTSNYSKKLLRNYLYKENIVDTNPINLLNMNNIIPSLCIHGDNDSIINVNNSISFINKLNFYNIRKNIQLRIIENASHEHTIDMIRGPGNKFSRYVFEFINEITNN